MGLESQELRWEPHPRAEQGCGMSCACTAPNRSSGCTPWECRLWDSKRETQPGLVSQLIILGCVWVSRLAFGGGPGEALAEMGITRLSGVLLTF